LSAVILIIMSITVYLSNTSPMYYQLFTSNKQTDIILTAQHLAFQLLPSPSHHMDKISLKEMDNQGHLEDFCLRPWLPFFWIFCGA